MTSSNENIFRVTGPICGEFTGPGKFPAQMPVTWSFDVFFDLRPNKRLSKQPWGWCFETLSWSLWRQCNGVWVKYLTRHAYWRQCRWNNRRKYGKSLPRTPSDLKIYPQQYKVFQSCVYRLMTHTLRLVIFLVCYVIWYTDGETVLKSTTLMARSR